MKRHIRLTTIVVLAMIASMCASDVNGITNPSFEDDGKIRSFRTYDDPNGWVSALADDIDAKVDNDWASDGTYSLVIYSRVRTFASEQSTIVSQVVSLDGKDELKFDLNCIADNDLNWDNTKVNAFVAVDGDVVWTSPNDVNVLVQESVDLSAYSGLAEISLGLQVIETGVAFDLEYYSMWDNIKLVGSGVCGGYGYYDTDLNFNCYVDLHDVQIMAEYWLYEEFDMPYQQLYDIDESGRVDLSDYARIAADYSAGLCSNSADSNCSEPFNALIPADMDLNGDGTVNFVDFAMIAIANQPEAYDMNDVDLMQAEWLIIGPPKHP